MEDGWHLLSGFTEKIFLLGLSTGGVLSLLFAAHFPVTEVVVMVIPQYLPEDSHIKNARLLCLFNPLRKKGPPNWIDEDA